MRSSAIILLTAAALLVGCGTANKTLNAEHVVRPATEDASADEMVTVARIDGERAVSTEYNLRYTLVAQLAGGDFVLRGTDGADGRYFASRYHETVRLIYKGPVLMGSQPTHDVPGGVFVDGHGAVWVYWSWGGPHDPVVRVPAPGLSATVTKEVDQYRRSVRLAREKEAADREAAAAARLAQITRLAAARAQNTVECAGAGCERAFAWAQAYLLKSADMRIQVATSTLIETYNPTSDGQVQMRLLKVPSTGDRWQIVVSADCRHESVAMLDNCTDRLIGIYEGFLPHMRLQ